MKYLKNLLIVFFGMFLSLNVLGQYQSFQRFSINYIGNYDMSKFMSYTKVFNSGTGGIEKYIKDSIINVSMDDTLYFNVVNVGSSSGWITTLNTDTISSNPTFYFIETYEIAIDTVSNIQAGDTLKFQFYYNLNVPAPYLPFICVVRGDTSDTTTVCESDTTMSPGIYIDTTIAIQYTGDFVLGYVDWGGGNYGGIDTTLICTTSLTNFVEVLPSPHVVFNDTVICQNTSITVNTTGSFEWSDGTLGQYLTPTTSGNYSVTVTSLLGCTAIDTAHIVVNPTYEIVENITTYNSSYELPDGSFVSTNGQYTTVLPTVNGCDSTIITNLEFLTTSIWGTDSEININVYPNPTNDQITIDFGSNYNTMNGYELKIINPQSQVVYSTSINQNQTTVHLSTWTGTGIYFVQLIDDQSNIIDIRKIILQ